jgi:hypothetical protein
MSADRYVRIVGQGVHASGFHLEAVDRFAIDVLACPHCGGRLRLVGTVEDPVAVREVLAAPRRAEPVGSDPPAGAPTTAN